MNCYYVVYKETNDSIPMATCILTHDIDNYFPSGTIIVDIYAMISLPHKKGVVK
jgi:hypothetical protein